MKPRVLFLNTLNSGISFWRMANYWTAALRTGVMEVRMPFWEKDNPIISEWQTKLGDPYFKHAYLGEISARLRDVDVCVMQMAHTKESLNVFLAIHDAFEQTGVPVVAECDDNYRNTPAYNPASEAYAPGSEHRAIATKQFRMADAMIVSTPGLNDLYSDYNDHVYTVPNAIDFPLWDAALARKRKKRGIRIGWAGGMNHDRDLKIIEPVIKSILSEYRDVRFVFAHGAPKSLRDIPGVEYHEKFAKILHYPKYIASLDLDIGLAPLEDNTFNIGKSNLRWLEYSALGIPTVASKVGHFAQSITHGWDGFLVDTADAKQEAADFEAILVKLITDRKERVAVGMRAREAVRQRFNVDFVVGTYAGALEEIAKRGRVPKDEKAIMSNQIPGLASAGQLHE